MIFYLERLAYRLTAHWIFFWMVLIPPLAYVGYMALTPSVYTLSSSFAVPEDAPVAQTGTPTGVAPLAPLISSPSRWEAFIKANFNSQRIMGYPRGYGLPISPKKTNEIYREALTNLSIKVEDNNLRTVYRGSDKELGSHLVFYYSTTLHQRIQEGYKRQGAHIKAPIIDVPRMDPVPPATRLAWSSDRAMPTLLWLFAGLVAFVVVHILLETMDSSYKSEKQIAEDTRLPILGRLPNLNAIPAGKDASQGHEI
ncbi:hypothetical protein [Desulfoluna butyratoxydans]|uniref:Uncharacterized protein n=1 Tax=Desulfoluna butyratoxydans TaxID=231438 RepID=A0A4U8YRN7_9BACT|nr:hypothetical protein [Desulfoluna butyratoxydans]VFQ44462.1 hypothetical protein MSL71_21110 [Desulfoluna butyratoxydans]